MADDGLNWVQKMDGFGALRRLKQPFRSAVAMETENEFAQYK